MSTSPSSLDFETTPVWELTIIGVDQGPPGPPQLTATITLTVSLTDAPEAPIFVNLPGSVSVLENETAPLSFLTLDYWDPENNNSVEIYMYSNPLTDKFVYNPVGK